jgi:uncharacterized protein (UPF0261 family)
MTTASPTILLIGTADTKADELCFMRDCITQGGGQVLLMNVGVLGTPAIAVDIPHTEVAAAANTTIPAIAALGDENAAMTLMAEGATHIALKRHHTGAIQGVLILGGTMGTDLALDVTAALPLGMPKFVISTVAYSHLIPPDRLAPDLMMILWAGGLYGLNSICQAILSQAAGAILGACRAVALAAIPALPAAKRPQVAITSLGKSALSYMVTLKPALEARGYEAVVFHCTGMGGRAMESLAAQGEFVAVLDLCLQEVGNEAHGSVVTSGADRLEATGRRGIPQIVAPGAIDMIDLQTWKPLPERYASRPHHTHNRLITSVLMSVEERQLAAHTVADKLRKSSGPSALVLPLQGIEAWDRPGGPLHDAAGLSAFMATLSSQLATLAPHVQQHPIDAHINDPLLCDTVLAIFDDWVTKGWIPRGWTTPTHPT